MPTERAFAVPPTADASAPPLLAEPVNRAFGKGLASVLRRDAAHGFLALEGAAHVLDNISQVLRTSCADGTGNGGDLPWAPDRGCRLDELRHRLNDEALQDAARLFVVDAIAEQEPRFKPTAVDFEPVVDEGVLGVAIRYDLVLGPAGAAQPVARGASARFTV